MYIHVISLFQSGISNVSSSGTSLTKGQINDQRYTKNINFLYGDLRESKLHLEGLI